VLCGRQRRVGVEIASEAPDIPKRIWRGSREEVLAESLEDVRVGHVLGRIDQPIRRAEWVEDVVVWHEQSSLADKIAEKPR